MADIEDVATPDKVRAETGRAEYAHLDRSTPVGPVLPQPLKEGALVRVIWHGDVKEGYVTTTLFTSVGISHGVKLEDGTTSTWPLRQIYPATVRGDLDLIEGLNASIRYMTDLVNKVSRRLTFGRA